MLIRKAPDIRSSEITPRPLYLRRREFIHAATGALAGSAFLTSMGGGEARAQAPRVKLPNVQKSKYTVNETVTAYDAITSYNNYYEFGTGKDEPQQMARKFQPRPWKISVEGEVAKPGSYDIDDFIKPHALEERVYRMRCVEGWSMVIPWVGIPLGDVVKRFEPTPKAQFVEFTTLMDPARMPGERFDILPWPYVEGLRMDEATHPLAILVVGLYGEVVPNQNGAPIRLVVPWKYGFKGIKAIVRMRFLEKQPRNTWQIATPREYGFYANVNPTVDHPRWSQASERRIGEFFRRKTLMFNGYPEVERLYAGMDLRRNY